MVDPRRHTLFNYLSSFFYNLRLAKGSRPSY